MIVSTRGGANRRKRNASPHGGTDIVLTDKLERTKVIRHPADAGYDDKNELTRNPKSTDENLGNDVGRVPFLSCSTAPGFVNSKTTNTSVQ
jgi:hypothetical protein